MSANSEEIFLYWGSGSSPCWRVQITLDEKGLTYGNKLLSFEKQEHKSEEIININPRGQLPTLKIGNITLNESLAACLYLEDKYKSQGTNLIPDDHKANVLQKTFEAVNLQKYCNENLIYYLWRTPSEKVDKVYVDEKKKELNKELERWETYLEQQNSSNIACNEFTMADVVFYPNLAFVVRCGYPLEKFPKLKTYYDTLKDRKSIKENWPPHWKTSNNTTLLADC